VNNSWLWIRAKRSGGEGGWGYQCEEGCAGGELASHLFQHGGSLLGMRTCTAGGYAAEAANSEALTRDVAYT
jgi:hypothetical protein